MEVEVGREQKEGKHVTPHIQGQRKVYYFMKNYMDI